MKVKTKYCCVKYKCCPQREMSAVKNSSQRIVGQQYLLTKSSCDPFHMDQQVYFNPNREKANRNTKQQIPS